MSIEIRRIVNTPIDSNCYIIYDKSIGNDCIIVDPGSSDNDKLYDELNNRHLIPRYIILTHEHYDHCWGVNDLKEKHSGLKIVCSRTCSLAIQEPRLNYSHYCCGQEFAIKQSDIVLDYINWHLNWCCYNILFESAKGHSASGIFMLLENALFTGDTLLMNARTITKHKTGSSLDLSESLKFLNSCKGRKYTVYPGHGDCFLLDDYDLSIAELGINQ